MSVAHLPLFSYLKIICSQKPSVLDLGWKLYDWPASGGILNVSLMMLKYFWPVSMAPVPVDQVPSMPVSATISPASTLSGTMARTASNPWSIVRVLAASRRLSEANKQAREIF